MFTVMSCPTCNNERPSKLRTHFSPWVNDDAVKNARRTLLARLARSEPSLIFNSMSDLFSFEICAGGGGQALGLEQGGFRHVALAEIDSDACSTLRYNRPAWTIFEKDVREITGRGFKGIDLFAGGVPCPPFSIAGKQLGHEDERDLFPAALDLIAQSQPTAVLLENVPGLGKARFADYRDKIRERLTRLGFTFIDWQVLNSSNFGVPQLRPRFILVALKGPAVKRFRWPEIELDCPTVGDVLFDLMASRGWRGAKQWRKRANGIGPTIVGGSKKHGGPDLGPTRAKAAWLEYGVDAMGIANEPPDKDFPADADPKLTVRMAARLQGFPDDWHFTGKKTAAYRQVGNAFPPPVARAVGMAIRAAILGQRKRKPIDEPLLKAV
ncbi:MAG TPA: DNA (cytosine-5-)-methyltransferase [Gemmatimonadaceae bacterium]|nr:DNA (cytosine-5-)-methyltransferase [Gemmatimonadaceae bacterium]